MYVKEVSGTNKNGKPYTGFIVHIGEYQTPMFFPSKVEALYIKEYTKNEAHKEFKGDSLDE